MEFKLTRIDRHSFDIERMPDGKLVGTVRKLANGYSEARVAPGTNGEQIVKQAKSRGGCIVAVIDHYAGR